MFLLMSYRYDVLRDAAGPRRAAAGVAITHIVTNGFALAATTLG